MQITTLLKSRKLTQEQWFMLSVLAVNAGNYLYNLILGRVLGPAQFADAIAMCCQLRSATGPPASPPRAAPS